jgi:gliding motility-associated-like protein
MRVIITIFILIATTATPWAQSNQENNWVFGNGAGINFNGATPIAFQNNLVGFGEGSASVSDENGDLLFYTEGSVVWNRNGGIMPNGNNLTGLTSVTTYSVTSSTSQGTMIIPMPGNKNKYYILSLTSMEQNGVGNAGKLYYSVVDMNLNGGLGDIEINKKGILVATGLSERLTAVIGDHCNIWVIGVTVGGSIVSYQVDFENFITIPVISTVGIPHLFTGVIVASPNGAKLAASKCNMFGEGLDGLMVFDYDISTGLASSPKQILPNNGAYGVAFSPDGSKLYASSSTLDKILQFDLSSNNATTIAATKFEVGRCGLAQIKLAPNGKLYFKSRDYIGSGFLSAINNPNLAGVACGYVEQGIALSNGTSASLGLPNMVPQYTFGKDTFTTTQTLFDTCYSFNISLYPTQSNSWGYVWSNGSTTNNLQAYSSGTYWVSYYTQPCSYNVDTFHILMPTINTANSCVGMANGTAWVIPPFISNSVTYTYTWTDTSGNIISTTDSLINVPQGHYILEVNTNTGCKTYHDISINNDDYNINFNADTLICVGTNVTYENISNTYYTHLEWTFPNNTTLYGNSVQYTFNEPGTFTITLKATGTRCEKEISKTIIVDNIPTVAFQIQEDSVCTGQFVHIINHQDLNNTIQYVNWDLGDGNYINNTLYLHQHAYDSNGWFNIIMEAQPRVCPSVSFKDSIYIGKPPHIDLGPDTSLCYRGKPIVLYNHTTLPSHTQYLWNTGETTAALEVKHHGTYSLTATTIENCSTTESITVAKDCYINIPNAFSPNNDGENDYFFPRQYLSSSVTAFTMTIYNRWGQIIFQTQNPNGRGWDGKFNDQEQPVGVYVYVIYVILNHDIPEHYSGNVTLMR